MTTDDVFTAAMSREDLLREVNELRTQPVTSDDRVRAVAALLELAEDQDTDPHARMNAASVVLNAPMFDYESETPASTQHTHD